MLRFKNLFSHEKFSCGLDIGTQAIKMVTLKAAKDEVELNSFGLEPIGQDLGAALKRIMDSTGIKTAGISVSGSSTVVRYADFPKMSEEELRQSVRFEAQKYIPFPISDVSLDSSVLKDDLPGGRMLVLLAAVKKDFISQRIKAIQEAGIRVENVDFDSLALVRTFNFNYPKEEFADEKNKTVALLNIGASISALNILEEGIPVFSRDIHIAGNNFTNKIRETLGLDPKAAEEMKVNPGKETGKAAASAEAAISELAEQLRVSFDYYESQSSSSAGKIFLSGGSSRLSGLKERLSAILGSSVQDWDPLKKIKISQELDPAKAKELSGQFAVAVGLALSR
ncbi:MAG: type IV pilus assembly protein PilM [Candidatus Omnitrophica bacterium]|nr:type IV pilus assembly protein PilM [Candidatus Omnitrophota bacterium]MDD5552631.1 type IV pilus assembly protein PilM [Candidatus Omnitrophota bacterium]